MKKSTFTWLLVFITLSIIGTVVLIYLGHYGPLGVKAGDYVICSELARPNGQKFCVIARRTGELIDAYHVFLYRIERNGETYKYPLGYEDSFWWGSSLMPAKEGREIEISAFWKLVARYEFDTDSVVRLHENYPPEHGRKVGNDGIEQLFPRQRR